VADEDQFEDDGITTADGLNALAYDLGTAAARLQELLGGQPDRSIAELPKVKRDEVRQIQRMFREWAAALREARQQG
jgi:hypothetical protein